MNWEKLLKTDACTLEAKEMLHQVLEKMGANNDLLESLRTHDNDDIRELLEDFSRTSPQKDIFKAILGNWDKCIDESQKNPSVPQVEMNNVDMYKILKRGRALDRPALTEAIKESADAMSGSDGVLIVHDDFYKQIQEKYKQILLSVTPKGRQQGWIGSHVKHKVTPERIRTIVGNKLKTFGYIKQRSNQWRRMQ